MFKTRIDIGVLAVLTINVLSFFIVVISNILIVPLEKIIQLTYIFKAKKKLKCYSHLIVVAITGSYGKTSTKNYLFKMLSEKFCVLKSPHSFNTPMGITKTILDYLKPHHQILILEMGADHKNDIKKLCKIVSPDICVVTAVGKQHLKTFKTFGNIVKTKYQIVEYAKGNALFVTNLTNDVCKCYYEKANLKKVGVDINNKCAYCNLTKLVANDNGLSFSCELDGFKIDLTSKLLGEFNVVNIMLAMSVAYKLGVNIGQICNAVSKLEPVNHRLELKQVNNNVRIIDDSFNSNPLGAKYAVEALKLFNCKRVVITCGMVELGAEQYAENFNFGKLLGCADKVFVVNNVNFAAISDGIRSAGGVEPENFNTFIEAYNCAIENAKEETVILIENDLTDSYIVWGEMKENLMVLFGGVSSEHDISIISALQAIKNINTMFYNVIPVYLSKDYKWYVGKDLNNIQTYSKLDYKKLTEVCLVPGSNYLHIKKFGVFKPKIKIDFAMPILHGVNGEDGKVVAILNLCKIPYSSPDFVESGLCIDKCLFKQYVNGLGVKSVKGVAVIDYLYKQNPEKEVELVLSVLDFPLIVKPATLGSSIGIKVCKNRFELEIALQHAFKLCGKVLIEDYLTDIMEVNVALMLDRGNLIVSELEQPIKNSEILSFENKYINKQGSMVGVDRIIPAPISLEIKNKIIETAKLVYLNMGLKGVVRFDFILKNDEVYLNELNSIPGSLAYYLFKPVGITYQNLINVLIKNGHENCQELYSKSYCFSSSVLSLGGEGVKK